MNNSKSLMVQTLLLFSIEELMCLSDPVMNNQTICLGRRVLTKQKYANEESGIATHINLDNTVSFTFSVSRLGVGYTLLVLRNLALKHKSSHRPYIIK